MAENRASGASVATPDAVRRSFVEKLPPFFQPYARLARLDRPIGWWLLLLPCWWSTAMAAKIGGQWPSFWLITLFLVGAIAMRGAGSTWNDITDRHIDAQVARTRNRPIPAGIIGVKQALVFAALQALVGLAVLLSLNGFSIVLGFLSLLPVAIYPFMKRVTNHPQVVLGFAFAWGALMGFAAVLGYLPLAAFLLYAGGIAWVVGYDTIYALQDVEDDAIIGIGSTALAYGKHVRGFILAMYALAIALIGTAMMASGSGLPGWLGLAGFTAHLVWQLIVLDQHDWQSALRFFRANRDAGLMLFAGLMVDAMIG